MGVLEWGKEVGFSTNVAWVKGNLEPKSMAPEGESQGMENNSGETSAVR